MITSVPNRVNRSPGTGRNIIRSPDDIKKGQVAEDHRTQALCLTLDPAAGIRPIRPTTATFQLTAGARPRGPATLRVSPVPS